MTMDIVRMAPVCVVLVSQALSVMSMNVKISVRPMELVSMASVFVGKASVDTSVSLGVTCMAR
jgi:hypothetical protein